jgi:hypothetical protein
MSTLADDYCLSEYETIIKYLLFFRFKTNPGSDPEFEKRSHQYIKKKNSEGVNRQFINYLIIQLSKKFSGVIQKDFALLKKEFNAENNYTREQLEKIIYRLRSTKQTLENLMLSSNDDLESYIVGVDSNSSEQIYLNNENFYEESNSNMMDTSMDKEQDNMEVPQSMIIMTPDEQVKIINYGQTTQECLPSIDIELINRLRKENNISDSLWEFLIQRFNYYDTSINNLKSEIAELKNK